MKTLRAIAPFTLIAASLAALSSHASANDGQHNLVTFSVSSQTDVANDESRATLSKSAQAKNAKELAAKLNPTINQALSIAKKYPDVVVSTGNRYSYPTYDKQGKIIGVTGHAGLSLKSQNTEQLSNLLNELQNLMTVDDLSFGVSDKLQEETQAHLMVETTKKFQAQAANIAKAWGAKSHRLVNVNMNTDQPYSRPYAAKMAMSEMAAADASMNLETGDSQIRYTINGTIQLIY